MADFSLIPEDYTARRERRHMLALGGKVAAGAVVACALVFGTMQLLIMRVQQEVADLQVKRELSIRQSDRLTALNDQRDDLVRQWQLLESLRSGVSAWRMLRTIEQEVRFGEIWFKRWQFRRVGLVSENELEPKAPSYFIMVQDQPQDGLKSLTHMAITGAAKDHVALSNFARRLLAEEDVDDVRVRRTNQVAPRAGEAPHVDFDLAVILKTDLDAS
ncbi:MAG: hypothetical protein O7H39_14470 [Gammaproteobacteria bacterium]|nr:hypothetical protein [Gammaproteobacteria bacterium]